MKRIQLKQMIREVIKEETSKLTEMKKHIPVKGSKDFHIMRDQLIKLGFNSFRLGNDKYYNEDYISYIEQDGTTTLYKKPKTGEKVYQLRNLPSKKYSSSDWKEMVKDIKSNKEF